MNCLIERHFFEGNRILSTVLFFQLPFPFRSVLRRTVNGREPENLCHEHKLVVNNNNNNMGNALKCTVEMGARKMRKKKKKKAKPQNTVRQKRSWFTFGLCFCSLSFVI